MPMADACLLIHIADWRAPFPLTQQPKKLERGTMKRKTLVTLMSLGLLASVFATSAAGQEKAKVEGIIKARSGDSLIVKTDSGDTTVVLTDDTTTKDDKGLFGLEKQIMSSTVLIPGVKVKVDGTSGDQGQVVAKTITVDGDDLEAAEMIQAGLHPTAEQVAANERAIEANRQGVATNKVELAAQKQDIQTNQQNIAANRQQIEQNIKDTEENTQRFATLADYDVKNQATVKFDTGSSKLSDQDREQLKSLADSAVGIKGYIVEVIGYADSTGSAAMNTKLSEARAKEVVTYLVQQCNVPPRHIVAPGAMGEYGAAAPNETKAGRAENRRVEVKVLVNKGIAGS
jgi:OmpA-OmpF porin, OOP family